MDALQEYANYLVTGSAVERFHDACLTLADWPSAALALDEQDVWYWIGTNHCNNCLLWDQEDQARRTLASDAEITANKRMIDCCNQARNDATERIDEFLLLSLGLIDPASVGGNQPRSTVVVGARLNSETGGSMIDRMSILSLKIRAMRAQAERYDVDKAHRDTSRQKLTRLEEQREDLVSCFDQLLVDSKAGKAYFKVYRQFKMYNDPRFNPVLVAEAQQKRQLQAER